MSLASKLFLGLSVMASTGTIMYVHFKQEFDQEQLHMGVMKDLERQRRRKIENIHLLQQQSELTREFQRDLVDKTNPTGTVTS